ncbi:hypothetical protein [Pantoea sp. App145]
MIAQLLGIRADWPRRIAVVMPRNGALQRNFADVTVFMRKALD